MVGSLTSSRPTGCHGPLTKGSHLESTHAQCMCVASFKGTNRQHSGQMSQNIEKKQ